MTRVSADVPVTGAVGLLERSIGYALGTLQGVTYDEFGRATPCAEWDLRMLLRHLNDSVAALQEAVDGGRVAASSTEPRGVCWDPASTLRAAAGRLLGSWIAIPPGKRMIAIGGCPMATSMVASTGALELAVHGWDIATARDLGRPIPPLLATELLGTAELMVGDRGGLFAEAVPVPDDAGPSDRLVAYLGRRPV
jgi:uncharacterized protein (TIGR03086 family)